jgi:hypothetical protein
VDPFLFKYGTHFSVGATLRMVTICNMSPHANRSKAQVNDKGCQRSPTI